MRKYTVREGFTFADAKGNDHAAGSVVQLDEAEGDNDHRLERVADQPKGKKAAAEESQG